MFSFTNSDCTRYATSKDYMKKNVKDWYGEDCLQWASDAEQQLNVPLSSWVSIDGFRLVTGRDLLRYNVSDFKRIVNEEYGPLFFKIFRKIVKERREDKASIKQSNMSDNLAAEMTSSYLDISHWTVPQLEFSVPEAPYADYGPSFDDLSHSIGGLSPSYGAASSFENLSPSYEGAPPSFAGTSPSIGAASPSFAGLSPNFSQFGNEPFERRDQSGPTYLTQPSMLSGGSISYGNSGNFLKTEIGGLADSNVSDSKPSFGECSPRSYDSGYSSLLPDFNSLLIKDSPDTMDENIDIDEMDSILKEESFSDLDSYVHSDENSGALDAPGGSGLASGVAFDETSQLLLPEDSSLEDCMLKKITTGKRGNRVRHPQSWEFLVRLLMNPKSNPSLIKWEDKENGIFRLVQKEEIAKLWGRRSSKHKDEPLAYDNFARIIRYHYKKKILVPVSDKHLVYKLGDKILMDLKRQGLL